MSDMTNWRAELIAAMAVAEDSGPIIAYAPDESTFDVMFNRGYGTATGPEVLAWTVARVYFPVTYDGFESLESAPRDPCPLGQAHVGGQ